MTFGDPLLTMIPVRSRRVDLGAPYPALAQRRHEAPRGPSISLAMSDVSSHWAYPNHPKARCFTLRKSKITMEKSNVFWLA